MPDNQEYLQVFENDEELENFLMNDDEDEGNHIIVVSRNCIQYEYLFTRFDHAKNLLEETSL
jgi:hypothetical protein